MASQTAPSRIREIAAMQKQLRWVILAAIAFIMVRAGFILSTAKFDPQTVVAGVRAIPALAILLAIVQIVAVVRLCLALEDGWMTLFYAFAMLLVPCISLLFLLILNDRATRRLLKAGIPIGLLGVRWSDVENYRIDNDSIACHACGEPVATGSKTCPMCGATV